MEKIVHIFEILFILFEIFIVIITCIYSLYRYRHIMKIYEEQQNEKPYIKINNFQSRTPIIITNMTEQINTREVDKNLYPFLIFNLNGIEIKTVYLNQETTFIGRGKNDDIMINESTISRSQCSITKEDSNYFINIDRRTNPIYINGIEVTEEETKLIDGDTVSLGNGKISFIFVTSSNISSPLMA
nr:FHA domain-containing protein [uncultured Acetatifactor sp.]